MTPAAPIYVKIAKARDNSRVKNREWVRVRGRRWRNRQAIWLKKVSLLQLFW